MPLWNQIKEGDFNFNHNCSINRAVQLKFTQEINVLRMLLGGILSTFNMKSVRNHIIYFNFRCEIQLDHPV